MIVNINITGINISGNNNQIKNVQIRDGNQMKVDSINQIVLLEKEIESLKKQLEEKERTINIMQELIDNL